MATTFNGRRKVRKSFGSIREVTEMPNLIEVQKASYDQFLLVDEPKGGRSEEGLQAVFKSVFPITDFSNTASLEFVKYEFEQPKYDVDECRQRGMTYAAPLKVTLICEPGRMIVGNAGVLIARVLYIKETRDKRFLILDAGMNALLRPSHYSGGHAVEPVEQPGRASGRVDVVGPICETGDFLALDREVELPEPGELLAIMTVGAYGFSMSSTYNQRPRPAEVMVEGDEAVLIRRRETPEDLMAAEVGLVRDAGQNGEWRKIFSGWQFKESPSLNVVEHPIYDVWVKDCTMSFSGEAPPAEASDSSTRSNSGSGWPTSTSCRLARMTWCST